MIARLKIIRSKEGKESEFEDLFNKLDADVKANESNSITHELYRSPKNSRDYIVVEKYTDQVAVDTHAETERKFFNEIRPLLEEVKIQTSTEFEEMNIPNWNRDNSILYWQKRQLGFFFYFLKLALLD